VRRVSCSTIRTVPNLGTKGEVSVAKTVIFPKKARAKVAVFISSETTQEALRQESSKRALDQATHAVRILADRRRAARTIRSEVISQSVAV